MELGMFSVSRALPADKTVLADLVLGIQSMHADAYPHVFKSNPDTKDLDKYFGQILSLDNNYIFIANSDNKTIGYVWTQIQEMPDSVLTARRSRLLVNHLFVCSEYRLLGVGKRLMEEVSVLAGEHNINEISLSTSAFNVGAQKFYRNLGFEIYELKMWKLDNK